MSGEKILQLPGGALAFQEYGDPRGQPVVFCHGWPSSRTMAELTDEAARELGVRMISPDRPGISRSDLQRERKLLDWPPVVRALADHLGLDQFRVLAISGGAPYAYASAWAMPERVSAIAVVGGAPPILELRDRAGLLPLYRWMLALYHKQPELLRVCFHIVRPVACVRWPFRLRPLILKLLQPCDASSLRESAAFEACFESQRRAWRGSAEGVMTDARVYADPWGFSLEDISVPVRLWHGTKDRSFSVEIAREVAGRLPNCSARFVEQAGHYSLPIRHMAEILRDLLAVKRDAAPALSGTM
jgi:pimeloyl-ACP methyl ester carboxylesterase